MHSYKTYTSRSLEYVCTVHRYKTYTLRNLHYMCTVHSYKTYTSWNLHYMCTVHSYRTYTSRNLLWEVWSFHLGVLSVTTRMMPSLRGCTLVVTAVGKWSGVMFSSLSRTRSPVCRFGTILCHRWRCCTPWR